MSDVLDLDASGQAEAVRAGEVSAAELTAAALERIAADDHNAVVIPLPEKARAEAARAPGGPFRGVPYLLKDLSLVSAGDPTYQSVAGARAAGYRADHDSFFVERMRAAGCVLVGKTNTDEMGMGMATAPALWGPTRNPWDRTRSPGGSSGGSAAAVAARLVALADGTDAAGSLRIPAAHCGVIGLKPTRGRVSVGPDVFADNLAGLAAEMCLARSVRDVAAVLDVVAGRRAGDPFTAPPPGRPFAAEVGAPPGRLRVGLLTVDPTGSSTVAPACAGAARAVAGTLAELGHEVEEGHPAVLDEGPPAELGTVMVVLAARGVAAWSWRLGRPVTAADVEPGTWATAQAGGGVPGTVYSAGVDALRRFGRRFEGWWDEGWDLLLTPTTPMTAPSLGETGDGDPGAFTVAANIAGVPAVSLPLGTDGDGLPVGVQLVAGFGREDLLLRVAAQLEEALPWAERRPQVIR